MTYTFYYTITMVIYWNFHHNDPITQEIVWQLAGCGMIFSALAIEDICTAIRKSK